MMTVSPPSSNSVQNEAFDVLVDLLATDGTDYVPSISSRDSSTSNDSDTHLGDLFVQRFAPCLGHRTILKLHAERYHDAVNVVPDDPSKKALQLPRPVWTFIGLIMYVDLHFSRVLHCRFIARYPHNCHHIVHTGFGARGKWISRGGSSRR